MPTKRNMIFCISSMPNQTMNSGTSAEMGRKRSGSSRGAKKCFTGGKVPMSRPERDGHRRREQEAHASRGRGCQPALRTSASSKCSTGKAFTTSVGEGRMTSGTMPA